MLHYVIIYLTKTEPKFKSSWWKIKHVPVIQQLVEQRLGAITWSNHFLYDFISLSHHCGGVLAHFPLYC